MGFAQKIDPRLAASVLDWWIEAGVDVLIDERPRAWDGPEAAPPAPPGTPAVARRAVLDYPNDLAGFTAWRLGDAAPEAPWHAPRIAPTGPAVAALMVMIDMPERDDGETLLDGAAGRLFDRMLAAIGCSRETVLLTAMCWARPSGGRIPPDDEATFAELARAHVRIAAPKRLLVLGNAASRALIGTDIARARGVLHGINHDRAEPGGPVRVDAVASFHPRFLLDHPAAKAESWADLQLLMGDVS